MVFIDLPFRALVNSQVWLDSAYIKPLPEANKSKNVKAALLKNSKETKESIRADLR